LLFVNETKCWSREKKIAVLGFKLIKDSKKREFVKAKWSKIRHVLSW
jgi:hypothetical protein